MAYFNQHQSMISKRYLTFFSKSKKKKPFSAGQLIGLILGPLLFLLTLLFFHPQDLPWKGVYVLAITLWIATCGLLKQFLLQQRAYYQLCYYH
nr:hypothetical protein [Staphylococcus aureus]